MNTKYLLQISGALLLGLLLGYFLFARTTQNVDANVQSEISETWTCSMHPQIRSDESGDCPICGMDLIPLNQDVSENPMVLKMTEQAAKLAEIQTTLIGGKFESSEYSTRLNGRIKSDERKASSLVSHIPGRIEKLFVSFTGENVRRGQRIATIYSPDLIAAQKELIEAKKIADLSPNLLSAAKSKLKYWKISKSKINEILEREKIQEYFDLYAEHNGVVTTKRVSVGDHLSAGSVLFDLQNLNRLWVLFDVYEDQLNSVRLNDMVKFTTSALPGNSFSTRITFIDPVINPKSRVTSIRGEVNNTSGQLKPEMFVIGELKKRRKAKSTLMIPKTAVLWTGNRSVAYVKLENTRIPSFEFREIVLGEVSGNHYILKSGIEAGEEVVTNGAFVIDAAAQLNNQTSMMNQNVSLKKENVVYKNPDFTSEDYGEFKSQLRVLTSAYFAIKNALVNTDPDEARQQGKLLLETSKAMNVNTLKREASEFWLKNQNTINKHSARLLETSDVESQRREFEHVSKAFIALVRAFGGKNEVYIQYCPMAFNNIGASWLSKELQIENPYFGDKMLRCGSVTDTL